MLGVNTLADYHKVNNILQKKYRRLQEDSDFRLKELVRIKRQNNLDVFVKILSLKQTYS